MLDDELVKKAFKYTKASTKRELIYIALKEFVENHSRRDVRELLGTIKIRDDYKSLRKEQSFFSNPLYL